MKIDLRSIDLVSVDGSEKLDRINLLTKIALNSLRYIKFNSVKIFTGYKNIGSLPKLKGIDYYYISLSSIKEYEFFIAKELYKYISSKHFLIYQYDGFIINPEKWSKKFLEYDYIGAVWAGGHKWSKGYRVGNGGFSLRSKNLMEYCSKLNWDHSHNEDVQICVHFRKKLVDAGFSFAPPEIASAFSLEYPTEYNSDIKQSFGFHGSSKSPPLYQNTLKFIKKLK